MNNEKWQLGTNFTFFVSLYAVAGWHQECTAGHLLLLWNQYNSFATHMNSPTGPWVHVCKCVWICTCADRIVSALSFEFSGFYLRLLHFSCLFHLSLFQGREAREVADNLYLRIFQATFQSSQWVFHYFLS